MNSGIDSISLETVETIQKESLTKKQAKHMMVASQEELMSCQRCKSERVSNICSKSSDLNGGEIDGAAFEGYVPEHSGIGGGDYVEFSWCMDCGQIQGDFPVSGKE